MPNHIWIFLLAIPGILSLIPSLPSTYQSLQNKFPASAIPEYNIFLTVTLLQTTFLVIIASLSGCYFSPKIGIPDQIPEFVTVKYSIITAIIFLFLIYVVAFPTLTKEEISILNEFRGNAGIFTRIFYGGIIEEILIRFGLMSGIAWLLSKAFGYMNSNVFWVAIILSAIIFAAGHLPIYTHLVTSPTINYIATILFLNFYAGIFFGWIFWKYGIYAAMLAHSLFHIIWYGFEIVCNIISFPK
jgi:hypothetical protein